ncbi:mitochondrial genome maintenance MGM101-domain-containing protein [Podospora appendiculata]|uniref:Mitochondrial genome maintenance protein MGM101 n=1 Tax=Podospora appendiculata TaxID=314037 RepID=A0AAE0X0W2_9PEZI|nr:mitochondrial genome maintenance MGM101-domain-containing protein [Podospora appendiculata]
MRSHALQACRPLRSTSSSALQCLQFSHPLAAARRPAFARAAVSTTSRPPPAATTPSRSASSSSAASRYPNNNNSTSKRPAYRVSNSGSRPSPTEDLVAGVIDPQAAVPPATAIEDVDPVLAARIPTTETGSYNSTAPSSAFTAAIASSGEAAPGGVDGQGIDWSSSFHGLSTAAFSPETAALLMRPLDLEDVEIKPDGIIYLPEIKYRRILNQAFGPGGWGLAPRGELVVGEKVVTREYALIVHGRFIAQARGECQYFSEETIPTAGEGCKSNALLRCCKDLGIASELWDPRFIRAFKKAHAQEIWVEHVVNKKKRQIWTRRDTEPMYPYQAVRK